MADVPVGDLGQMAPVEPGTERLAQPLVSALAIGWRTAAAVAAVAVPLVIGASLPVLTLVWLAIAALVLRRAGTPLALGLVWVPGLQFARVTVAAIVAMTVLFGAAEVVCHPYRELLDLIRAESTPDSTFAWVIEHGRGWGLVGFAAYGALVTIFAEEIVFRGVLMTWLRQRGPWVAVGGTTVAFAAVQALPAALLSVGAGVGFLVIDSVLAVGVVGGLGRSVARLRRRLLEGTLSRVPSTGTYIDVGVPDPNPAGRQMLRWATRDRRTRSGRSACRAAPVRSDRRSAAA